MSLLVVPWFCIWQNASEVSFRFPSLFSPFSLPLLMLFRFCFCCCFVIVNHRNVSSVCECVCVCLLGKGASLGFVVSTHKIYIALLFLFFCLSSPLCSQFFPISDFCAILRAFVFVSFFCGPLTWPELFEVPPAPRPKHGAYCKPFANLFRLLPCFVFSLSLPLLLARAGNA